jgi:hypothetical protein
VNAQMQPRAMPVRWAVVLASVVGMGLLAWGYVAGQMIASKTTPAPVERCFVDAILVPVAGGARVWSVRWIEYGQTRIIQVEGDETRDRLKAWIEGGGTP